MVGNLILNKTKLVTEDGFNTSVQHPLPTDGDSVYQKDIDIDLCDNGGFTGACCDYFNSLTSVNTDSSVTSPKTIKLWFKRTVYSSSIGFGCHDLTKNFSNIKISLLGSGEEVRLVIDDSADSTKRNSYLIKFTPSAFNGVLIQFYTTDEVGLSNLTIPKEGQVSSRISGIDVVTDKVIAIGAIQGDTGYNLKVSVDQVEPTTNSLKIINYSHAELHGGTHYFSRSYIVLGNGATANLLIVTPNTTKWAHMIFGGSGEDGAIITRLYEDTVTSSDGIRDNERNRNRNYPDNNTTFVYRLPVVVSNGTLISDQAFGSGKSSGGGGRDAEEILLKQNTKYLFQVTNNTVSNNHVNWTLDWYEHTNK